MKMFKILKVRFLNFKRFKEETELNIDQYDTVIFGGKNGFGKTTLFDAIELVLTGKIKRYEAYVSNYTDKRQSYSDYFKPLVCDTSIEFIRIELYIQDDQTCYWLKREACTSDLTNPISFIPFATLYRKNDDERDYTPINGEIEIISQYNFLHYIEQEESTLFLKSKAKDRGDDINQLFDIEELESIIDRAKTCKKHLTLVKKGYEEALESTSNKIHELQAILETISDTQQVEYTNLLKPGTLSWDQEHPPLSKELIEHLTAEDGVLSNMAYYLNHNKDYNLYIIDQVISPFLEEARLNNLALHLYYKDKQNELNKYLRLQELADIWGKDRNEQSLKQFIELQEILHQQLPSFSNIIDTLVDKAKAFILRYNQYGDLQKSYIDLYNKHSSLSATLCNKEVLMDIRSCPLCGSEYDSNYDLLEAIKSHGEILDAHLKELETDLHCSLKDIYNHCQQYLLNPLKIQIEQAGITQEVVNAVKSRDLHSFLEDIRTKFNIELNPEESLEKTTEAIKTILTGRCQNFNQDLDYTRIVSFLREYKENLNSDNFTIENIQKKKTYLLSKWREQSSQQMQKLKSEEKLWTNRRNLCDQQIKNIKKLEKDVKEQKESYLTKLISDIEILFYIYSGRIMQDSHFGRGIFMKYDQGKVLFVTGTYQSDLDCLYNLSSGQISVLIISFTLALNKLYARSSFLAIDDPIQTIDDMNLWGLIETLRHEFRGYNLLLSTHEEEYGSLLRYKSEKLDIFAKVIDIRDDLHLVGKHIERGE